jgi:preprotein translocase subunit SecF
MVWNKLMEFFKAQKTYSFMEKRIPFLILSIFLILASIILIFTKGLNFGIDFTGGTVIQVKYDKKAPVQTVREILNRTEEFKNASVALFG